MYIKSQPYFLEYINKLANWQNYCNTGWPGSKFCFSAIWFRCFGDLWAAKLFRDLYVFQQELHVCVMPVMWWASMCFLMSFQAPCFPQTLQILAFPYFGKSTLLTSIIDLICSFRIPSGVSRFLFFS